MKTRDLIHIKKAEVLQLFTLNNLFNESESAKVIFQGGTALRWMYNGTRFSEDLDFITTLSQARIKQLIQATAYNTQNTLIFTGNPGQFNYTLKEKKQLIQTTFVQKNGRNTVRLKLEFYQVPSLDKIGFTTSLLGAKPSVNKFIQTNNLPRPDTLIIHETPQGILADKIIAILKRPYIKGRDFWDMWYLKDVLNVESNPDILANHLKLYPAPDLRNYVYTPGYNGWPNENELQKLIEKDLRRFISPAELIWWREQGFKDMAQLVETTLKENKNVLEQPKAHRNNKTTLFSPPSF